MSNPSPHRSDFAIPEGDWDADVAVIGGGPGGQDCARELAAAKLRVVLIDDAPLPGGECLWRGCVPSKVWRAAADRLRDRAVDPELGVTGTGGGSLDWAVLEAGRRALQEERGLLAQKTDRAAKIEAIEGRARFTGEHEIEIALADAATRTLSFGAAVIATGAPPFVPPIAGAREGLEGGAVLTSDTIWDLAECPGRLVVVGAGAIGVEMAQIFHDFGGEVTLIEALDRILPEIEDEIARKLAEVLEAEPRLAVHTSAKVTKIEGEPGSVTVSFNDSEGGEHRVEADRVLMATGKRPALDDLGLEAAGVKCEKGVILADAIGRTSRFHIFAVGDVIGGLMLAHTAAAQGRVAARNLLGESARYTPDHDGGVIFSRPQAASVGLSLAQAKARGIDAGEMKTPLALDAKAMIAREKHGLLKIVAEKESGRILGAHLLADHADTLVGEAVLMVSAGVTLEQVAGAIHPHPTQTEIWGDMARRLLARFRRSSRR